MPEDAQSSASSATKAPKRKSIQDDQAFMQNVQHEEVKRAQDCSVSQAVPWSTALCFNIAKASRCSSGLRVKDGRISASAWT